MTLFSGCSPTIKLKAPNKPVDVNVNLNINHQINVKKDYKKEDAQNTSPVKEAIQNSDTTGHE